jgi:hypothetical protein
MAVRAFLETPVMGFGGWGQANIAGIENPTLRNVFLQLIADFEGDPAQPYHHVLDAKYKNPVDYRIEVLAPDGSMNPSSFKMETPYDATNRDHASLCFLYSPGSAPAAGGRRRKRKTRRRKNMSRRR